jgi:hypothetical protein
MTRREQQNPSKQLMVERDGKTVTLTLALDTEAEACRLYDRICADAGVEIVLLNIPGER